VGKLHNGPFETEREARAAAHQVVRPEQGWSILHKSQNRFVVEQACETAGVELGVYDRQIIDWLSGFEDSVCAVVAGLVARAVAATRPGPRCVTFDLTDDHHAEMYFVLTVSVNLTVIVFVRWCSPGDRGFPPLGCASSMVIPSSPPPRACQQVRSALRYGSPRWRKGPRPGRRHVTHGYIWLPALPATALYLRTLTCERPGGSGASYEVPAEHAGFSGGVGHH
jgi:hypothetical protein